MTCLGGFWAVISIDACRNGIFTCPFANGQAHHVVFFPMPARRRVGEGQLGMEPVLRRWPPRHECVEAVVEERGKTAAGVGGRKGANSLVHQKTVSGWVADKV